MIDTGPNGIQNVGLAHTVRVAGRLSHVFSRHILGLQLLLNDKGKPVFETFTGFRFSIGADVWVTAGHVIDKIKSLRARFKLVGAHLLDFCDAPGDEGIPIDLSALLFDRADEADLDIGWAFLPAYYSNLLKANRIAEPLTDRIWRGRTQARPDAYYLVGMPDELAMINRSGQPNGGIVSADVAVACTPLEIITPPPDVSNEPFWSKQCSVYAKVLPLSDSPSWSIRDIRGMSGGPIFGVRYREKEIRYWLYGIQSSWLPSSRILRATAIEPFAAAVEELLGF